MRVLSRDEFLAEGARPIDRLTSHRVEEVTSFEDLAAWVESLHEEGYGFVATLDDVNQCVYTSGHAAEKHGLDVYEDPDLPSTRDEWRETCLAAFQDPGRTVAWDDIAGTLVVTADDVAALVDANRNPDDLLDSVSYVQRAQVSRNDLLIAALPNGYFAGDWDPFQNHAVIRRLALRSYRLVAIGAAWLGFVRPEPLTSDDAVLVVADLAQAYGDVEGAAPHWAELAEVLGTRRTLVLGYTEDFAETLE